MTFQAKTNTLEVKCSTLEPESKRAVVFSERSPRYPLLYATTKSEAGTPLRSRPKGTESIVAELACPSEASK